MGALSAQANLQLQPVLGMIKDRQLTAGNFTRVVLSDRVGSWRSLAGQCCVAVNSYSATCLRLQLESL